MAQVHPAVAAAPYALPEASGTAEAVRPRSAWSWPAYLSAVTAAGAFLRFAGLGHNSVWFDEAYLVKLALAPWTHALALLRTADFHPPLYYLLMHAWLRATPLSDAAIRVPSACFGVVTLPLTGILVRRIASPAAACLAALLVALSPFSIMAAQDARMYTLLGVLVLASTLALDAACRRGGVLRWSAYAGFASLALYTHYLAFLVMLAQGVAVGWGERRALRSWLAAAAAAIACCLPWLPSLWIQVSQSGAIVGPDRVSLRDLSQLAGLYAFGGSLLGMPGFFFRDTPRSAFEQSLLLLPFLGVAALGVRACRRAGRPFRYLVLPLIVPVGCAFVSALVRPPFAARWFSFLVPFAAAVLSIGVIEAAGYVRGDSPRRGAGGLRATAVIAIGLVLYSVPVLARYYLDPGFRPYNWRAAAAVVRARARPGDRFLYGGYQNELAFTYYYGATAPEALLQPGMDGTGVPRAAGSGGRVWLIVAPPFSEAMLAEAVAQLRTGGYAVIGRNRGPGLFPVVMLLQAAPSSGRGGGE